MFLTMQKLEARTRQLEAFRLVDMNPVTPLVSMPGNLGPDDVYRNPPARIDGAELRLEDEFSGRDRYLWAEKNLMLSPRRDGFEVTGVFDFGKTGGGHNSGFESLLYVNGQPYQGVDTNHMDVCLEKFAGQTVTLTFLLWTGLEGGGEPKPQHHRVRQAHIGYLHKVTDEFYYFSKAIYKTLKLLPDTAPEKHALTAALDRAYGCLNWDKFYETVPLALDSLLSSLGKMEKQSAITVGVVGHTHIDVAWLWRLKHTREKTIRSFSTVLRLMEEFDEFIFLQTQPQLYKYIKNDAPALYEQIKKRIAEGKWEADGGMWVEADCNISSGEALVRQLLYGVTFLKEEFGQTCEYLWLPDVFGYSWALPQILKLCNIKTFMTTKISWNQYNSIPHDLFQWRGIDGSEILTYFITTPEIGFPIDSPYSTYNGMISPRSVLGSWQKFKDKAISQETLISYGFGDGGGGVNRNMLKMRRATDKLPGLPNVKTTRAGDFFSRLHESVKNTEQYVHTWDGELYLEYHRGTYTSQAHNKWMNRRLENTIACCEWLSSLVKLSGGGYPSQTLHDAWETVLLHQFHDIIPGSSIREVYEDSDKAYAHMDAEVCKLTEQSVGFLSASDTNSFTLYHFGSFPRRDLVFLPADGNSVFKDADGAVLSAQRAENGWWVNVDMEPLSLKAVTVVSAEPPKHPDAFAVDMSLSVLDTPLYQIVWNQEHRLTSVFDKKNRRQVLTGEGNALEIYEDKPLRFDNWDIDIFHTQKKEPLTPSAQPELLECGSERCVIRFSFAFNNSSITQNMIAYNDCARIDFETEVNWHEKDKLLKTAFPVDIRATKATYDIQFGHVERPTHWNTSWDFARFEVVGHKWADISEADYGVSLLNNCKYGYSVRDNVLCLTLLKSSKYPDTECDMGTHHFTYALLPHSGTVTQGHTIEESVKLNLPVEAVPERRAATDKRIVRIDSINVIVDAVKKAEAEDCLVLRFHECRGTQTRVRISSDYPLTSSAACNLLEENLESPVEGGCIEVFVKPFEIKSYKLWFAGLNLKAQLADTPYK